MCAQKIYKPRPVSGFPEWLPEVRKIELQWFDHIRRIFESYGYCSIETPSVEELNVVHAKGADVDKEIYVLERLQADPEDTKEARLALRFDQTVPLARYTALHFNDLIFPFKRYQMQRAWRGERPQAGRFREFYQCDIDVINVDHLPLSFDAEMPAVIWEVLSSLPGMEHERIQLRISNRKVLMGACRALGIENHAPVLRWIDKLDKIGADSVIDGLREDGLTGEQISGLQGVYTRTVPLWDPSALKAGFDALRNPPFPPDPGYTEGLEELRFVADALAHLPEGAAAIDLSIVRGLDYYTGTVYETVFVEDPNYGSICSGGRYDDLAGSYINKHLPGVGISIGFSRLFDRLRTQGNLPLCGAGPADILMVLPAEERRAVAAETARALRARGYNVELYHAPQKLKKQLSYAERKGIPFVWFPPFEDGQSHEVKNMETGKQTPADPEAWERQGE